MLRARCADRRRRTKHGFYLANPTTCGTPRCVRRCNSDLVSGSGRRLRRSSSPRKVRISTRSFCLSLGLFNFSAFVPNAKPFKARSSPKRTSWPAELGLPALRIHNQSALAPRLCMQSKSLPAIQDFWRRTDQIKFQDSKQHNKELV